MVWHFIGKVHNTKACKAGELRHLPATLVAAREAGTVKKQRAKVIEDRLSGSPRVSVSLSRGDAPEAGKGR
jgi:uncharacterized pyridoxal phosphate-containing UPF0001 family protein